MYYITPFFSIVCNITFPVIKENATNIRNIIRKSKNLNTESGTETNCLACSPRGGVEMSLKIETNALNVIRRPWPGFLVYSCF